MIEVMCDYAMREDGQEKGAEQHRFTEVKIDESKGSATGISPSTFQRILTVRIWIQVFMAKTLKVPQLVLMRGPRVGVFVSFSS